MLARLAQRCLGSAMKIATRALLESSRISLPKSCAFSASLVLRKARTGNHRVILVLADILLESLGWLLAPLAQGALI
jgi:hypothetical protein